MTVARPVLTPQDVRRLAITRQRLAGPRPAGGREGIREVVRDLGCVQLDPINAVDRSHRLVLWSRLGAFDPADLDHLRFEERRYFEYWAHAASIVRTADYPVHRFRMLRAGTGSGVWQVRHRAWLAENEGLRRHVMRRLRRDGPLPSREIEDLSARAWVSGGWTSGRSVERMLTWLWTKGDVAVAGRAGGQRLWDLAERCLPDWTPRGRLTEREVVWRAAQTSLRALGAGRARDITEHFTRGGYPGLGGVLAELEAAGRVVRVDVVEPGSGAAWPGAWYVHAEDLALVEALRAGAWEGRTTLLSPFDNLVCDRARTEIVFGFRYRIEIYVPPAKREYGYYVLPILHDDRVVGRIDPRMDRRTGRLVVNAVYWEPEAAKAGPPRAELRGAIESLAGFLGAEDIDMGPEIASVGARRP